MPTGYTATIADGITFEQFVMRCARAMGACMSMRDEPMGKPIPERFEPSEYYARSLAESRVKLEQYLAMSVSDSDEQYEASFQQDSEQYEKRVADKNALRDKYRAMLESVKCWTPPTDEHAPFKKFMIEQLSMSMDSDCSTEYDTPPERVTPAEWLVATIKRVRENVVYLDREYRKGVERTESGNQWLASLRKSLLAPSLKEQVND